MEKFLEKFQLEIEKKMLACIKGESIVKPFSKIYNEVRHREEMAEDARPKRREISERKGVIYTKGEESIYAAVVKEFLEAHPDLKEEIAKRNAKEQDDE